MARSKRGENFFGQPKERSEMQIKTALDAAGGGGHSTAERRENNIRENKKLFAIPAGHRSNHEPSYPVPARPRPR